MAFSTEFPQAFAPSLGRTLLEAKRAECILLNSAGRKVDVKGIMGLPFSFSTGSVENENGDKPPK